jgi:putative DNA primase/helicase
VLDLLGEDFAIKAAPELVMIKRDAHPTERADLFGKRLVACVETSEGKRLAETLVKDLTGGDKQRARRMREDFWQFDPTHKIILATNHKPEIRGTDHAIWRRIRLVPFNVTVPENEQDPALPDKLRAELPGILAWCVRGCLDWQEHRLGTPEEVKDATAAFRQQQDVLGMFIDERCIVNADAKVKSGDLYAAYKAWCLATGEHAVNQTRFGEAISERGFGKMRSGGHWRGGIGLLDSDHLDPLD